VANAGNEEGDTSRAVAIISPADVMDAEDIANAAYIAAAPDMYAALESALKLAEFEGHAFRPWQEEARVALAKARGEAV